MQVRAAVRRPCVWQANGRVWGWRKGGMEGGRASGWEGLGGYIYIYIYVRGVGDLRFGVTHLFSESLHTCVIP